MQNIGGEAVVMDVEGNNRPLRYVESDSGEHKLLTPNLVMWGQGTPTFRYIFKPEQGWKRV